MKDWSGLRDFPNRAARSRAAPTPDSSPVRIMDGGRYGSVACDDPDSDQTAAPRARTRGADALAARRGARFGGARASRAAGADHARRAPRGPVARLGQPVPPGISIEHAGGR